MITAMANVTRSTAKTVANPPLTRITAPRIGPRMIPALPASCTSPAALPWCRLGTSRVVAAVYAGNWNEPKAPEIPSAM